MTAATTTLHDEGQTRLVRNLMALRLVLSMNQMKTGEWGEHIEELDEALAGLGHDMKSTAARAAEGMRRTFVLPRLVSQRTRAARRRSRPAVPRG